MPRSIEKVGRLYLIETRRNAVTVPPTSLSVKISTFDVFQATCAYPLFQSLRGPSTTSLDVRGIGLLNTLQELIVFGFNGGAVRGNVVQSCTDLRLR